MPYFQKLFLYNTNIFPQPLKQGKCGMGHCPSLNLFSLSARGGTASDNGEQHPGEKLQGDVFMKREETRNHYWSWNCL